MEISRRDFLKLGATSIIGLGFRDFTPWALKPLDLISTYYLGRTVYSLRYYEEPSYSSNEKGYYITDSVVRIYEKVKGDPKPTNNPIWLRTEKGWLHSAYVQPVKNKLNKPLLDIPGEGMLMEVTVPFTQAWKVTDRGLKRYYRCYYGSTYWVFNAFTTNLGSNWYQFFDERTKESYQFQAEHLRPITPEELTQIAANGKSKRIEIDLEAQELVAFEDSMKVFIARTATGYFEGDTPRGEFKVERKQPTRHMASNSPGNSFDLPGVPWVCYISWTGVSFHGTYWHNNFGNPQSHGCINLTPEASKWIYRWTEPFVPFGEDYVETDYGTKVLVY